MVNPLTRVRAARKRRDESEAAFYEAVRQAYAERGTVTVDALAEAAGISRQRVYQLVADGSSEGES